MLSSFSSPYSGRQGLLLNSFSIERTVQCDGCLIWGLGWRAGLVAGLRVGQAYGGVPPTWVWVVGVSPQILEHPTSICDTGVNWTIVPCFVSFPVPEILFTVIVPLGFQSDNSMFFPSCVIVHTFPLIRLRMYTEVVLRCDDTCRSEGIAKIDH